MTSSQVSMQQTSFIKLGTDTSVRPSIYLTNEQSNLLMKIKEFYPRSILPTSITEIDTRINQISRDISFDTQYVQSLNAILIKDSVKLENIHSENRKLRRWAKLFCENIKECEKKLQRTVAQIRLNLRIKSSDKHSSIVTLKAEASSFGVVLSNAKKECKELAIKINRNLIIIKELSEEIKEDEKDRNIMCRELESLNQELRLFKKLKKVTQSYKL